MPREQPYTAPSEQSPAEAVTDARPQIANSATIEVGGIGSLQGNGLTVAVRRKDLEDKVELTFTGKYESGDRFELQYSLNEAQERSVDISIAEIDPSSDGPELLLTGYSPGAHCCALEAVARRSGQGSWELVDLGQFDGEGLRLVDLDSDGSAELVGIDQSFLYAFDSYAASVAPILILQVRGTQASNVTRKPPFQEALRADLERMEELLAEDPSLVKSNGFLAGWVAAKMRLGQGREAWAKMLANFDRDNIFGPSVCGLKMPLKDCPEENRVQLAFPVALKQHLQEQGYWSLRD